MDLYNDITFPNLLQSKCFAYNYEYLIYFFSDDSWKHFKTFHKMYFNELARDNGFDPLDASGWYKLSYRDLRRKKVPLEVFL
jgi:hypothetical protein